MAGTTIKVQLGVELEFMVANHLEFGDPLNKKNSKPSKDRRFPDNVAKPLYSQPLYHLERQCIVRVAQAIADCGLPVAIRMDENPAPEDPRVQILPDSKGTSVSYGALPVNQNVSNSPLVQYRFWNMERATHGPQNNRRFNYWFVETEGYMTAEVSADRKRAPKGAYDWYAIEISSPVSRDAANLNQDLSRIFASLQGKLKIWLNASCGMHIHASPSNGSLTLPISKKVAALVALLEKPLIEKITHPTRHNGIYCEYFSEKSRIAVDSFGFVSGKTLFSADMVAALVKFRASATNRSADEPRLYKLLIGILNQISVAKLSQGLHRCRIDSNGNSFDGGRCGLALSRFDTMEFRYMQASFDTVYVSFWIEFITTIFSIAELSSEEYTKKLMEIYAMATHEIPQDWTKYLQVLGLSHLIGGIRDYTKKYSTSLKKLDKQPILPKVEEGASGSASGSGSS